MDFNAYKNNVIRHEVGHWVVARQLGYDVGEIMIRINRTGQNMGHDAHAHINLHPSLKSIDDIDSYLIDRISILWAGIMYQSTVDSRNVESIKDTDGASDFSKLRELSFVLRGIRFSEKNSQEFELEQMRSITNECWGRAKDVIEANSPACEILANKISQHINRPNFTKVFEYNQLCEWFDQENISCNL